MSDPRNKDTLSLHFHIDPKQSVAPTPIPDPEELLYADLWRKEALCIGLPLTTFFPESAESNLPAKKICQECPVRIDCLDYAIATTQDFGIWAGTTSEERKKIRRMVNRGKGLEEALIEVETKRRGRSKTVTKKSIREAMRELELEDDPDLAERVWSAYSANSA